MKLTFTDRTIAEESFSEAFDALASVRALFLGGVAHGDVNLAVRT